MRASDRQRRPFLRFASVFRPRILLPSQPRVTFASTSNNSVAIEWRDTSEPTTQETSEAKCWSDTPSLCPERKKSTSPRLQFLHPYGTHPLEKRRGGYLDLLPVCRPLGVSLANRNGLHGTAPFACHFTIRSDPFLKLRRINRPYLRAASRSRRGGKHRPPPALLQSPCPTTSIDDWRVFVHSILGKLSHTATW